MSFQMPDCVVSRGIDDIIITVPGYPQHASRGYPFVSPYLSKVFGYLLAAELDLKRLRRHTGCFIHHRAN
jgi:hypothetical protein